MIRYRDATIEDAPAIDALFRQGFIDTFGPLYDPKDLAAFFAGFTREAWRRELADSDFAFRTYRFGMAILLLPEVQVVHYGARTSEQWVDTCRNYGIGDGAFYSKHIRCGDGLALRLFLAGLLRIRARQIVRLVTQRRWRGDPYADHLFHGVREAWKFAIDRERRLFRETPRARMVATPANAVTPSPRGDDAAPR